MIFQGNLFAAFDDCKNWLGFVTEFDDFRGTLTGNKHNYKWLVDCFGRAEADKLLDKKIICSGTIVGSVREMKTFCRELWRILEPKVAEDIFDQAATNWLVYNGRVPVENIFEINVDSGEIFTADLYIRQKSLELRNGLFRRGDGSIPEVVDQYDRGEELIRLVDKLYRDKNFSFDARFTDTRSTLEQVVCLLCADKISEATRRFMKIFLSTEDLSVYVDLLMEIWALALRQDFSPTVEMLEVAAQNSLFNVQEFFYTQTLKLQKLFVTAVKNAHFVNHEFKNDLANHLLKIAEYHHNAGNVDMTRVFKIWFDELNARS